MGQNRAVDSATEQALEFRPYTPSDRAECVQMVTAHIGDYFAFGELADALRGCNSKHDWRYGICQAEYDSCKEGRAMAWEAVLWGAAAVGTYFIYQGAKDTFAVLSGQGELIFAP